MPTAEQCRAYAAEYHRLGQEADVSIQRALALWNWWEEPVPKKRTSTPMEIQPVSGPRPDDAISMGSSPSKKPKQSGRPPQSACRDLVPDPLGGDLPFELGKGQQHIEGRCRRGRAWSPSARAR